MKDINYITPEENERRLQYYEFCKIIDSIMTDDDDIPDQLSGITYEDNKYGYDDFFTGDISKSSRTDTNKDINM